MPNNSAHASRGIKIKLGTRKVAEAGMVDRPRHVTALGQTSIRALSENESSPEARSHSPNPNPTQRPVASKYRMVGYSQSCSDKALKSPKLELNVCLITRASMPFATNVALHLPQETTNSAKAHSQLHSRNNSNRTPEKIGVVSPKDVGETDVSCEKFHSTAGSTDQSVSDLSFIPIIFTNSHGETQEIIESDLPAEVLTETTLAAFSNHLNSSKSNLISNSSYVVSGKSCTTEEEDKILSSDDTAPDSRNVNDSLSTQLLRREALSKLHPSSVPITPSGTSDQSSDAENPKGSMKCTSAEHFQSQQQQESCSCHSQTQPDANALISSEAVLPFNRQHVFQVDHDYDQPLYEENLTGKPTVRTSVFNGNHGIRCQVFKDESTNQKAAHEETCYADSLVSSKATINCSGLSVCSENRDSSKSVGNLSSCDNAETPAPVKLNSVRNVLDTSMKSFEKCVEPHSNNLFEKVACYKCKFCLFLTMTEMAITNHVQREHGSGQSNVGVHCPGCSNVFFSKKSLKVHLSEDHNTADQELKQILDSFGNSFSESSIKKTEELGQEQSHQLHLPASFLEPRNESTSGSSFKRKLITETSDEHKESMAKSNEPSEQQQPMSLDLMPADETGKIRVRKLSSLEKLGNKVNERVLHSNPHEDAESNQRGKVEVTEGPLENAQLSPTVDLIEIHDSMDTSDHGGDGDMDCDSESDVAIKPVQMQKDFIQHEQPVINKQFDSTNLLSSNLKRTKDSPQIENPCDVLVVEMRDEQIVDVSSDQHWGEGNGDSEKRDSPELLTLDLSRSDLSDDENNPEVICSSSSEKRRSNEDENNRENLDTSNIIVETPETTEVLTKKVVKSARTAREPSKKELRKKKVVSRGSRIKKEVDVYSYRCRVTGCAVRLFSHDKLQYHLRSHILIDESTQAGSESQTEEAAAGVASKGRMRFNCPECSNQARSWPQLTNHLWRCHSIDMELYTCEQCGYKTSSFSRMMNMHKRIHSSDKPFLCDSCGKGFKTTKQLRNHKDVHLKKARAAAGHMNKCELCGRTFTDARMLRSHISTVHDKVRPYMCSECGHTAANRSSLKMHLRQHTGDRPYSCDECEYRTADHNSLRRHKKRHTGEKPYKCPHCPYASIQSTTYKSHLKSKHPGQDTGLLFNCDRCAHYTVNHDIHLAHVAEHETEGGLITKMRVKANRRQPQHVNISEAALALASTANHMPIVVSIASDEPSGPHESSVVMAGVIQNVSEAIIPGSPLHLIYNGIALEQFSSASSFNSGDQEGSCEQSSHTILVREPITHFVNLIQNSSQEDFATAEEQITGDLAEIQEPPEELKFMLREECTVIS